MYDFLLTPEARELKNEARRFAREEVSADFLRKMEDDAMQPDHNERCYTDEDMQHVFDKNTTSQRKGHVQ